MTIPEKEYAKYIIKWFVKVASEDLPSHVSKVSGISRKRVIGYIKKSTLPCQKWTRAKMMRYLRKRGYYVLSEYEYHLHKNIAMQTCDCWMIDGTAYYNKGVRHEQFLVENNRDNN